MNPSTFTGRWLQGASFALVLGLFLGSFCPAAARAEKLLPVDEAKKDPSFHAFRRELVAALRRGDRVFVLGVVDPKITASFGGHEGIEGFKKYWDLDRPGPEGWNRLRDTLLTILDLGGSFQGDGFCAPYVFSRWPDDRDAFEYSAVIGRGVALRSGPSLSAPVLTRLTYDLVKVPSRGADGDGAWVKVIAPSGKPGYVSGRYLRSPIDYRACFKKAGGKWRMTVLVAGD